MKNLQGYIKEHLNINENEVQIEEFLKNNYNIKNCTYEIKDDIVNIKGMIKLTNKSLESLTDGNFEFGTIKGSFDCSSSNILALDFGPNEVTGSFDCSNCQLQTLSNAPKKIGEDFDCSNNPLLHLMDGPREVGEVYNCSDTNITDLRGIAKKVDTIICDNCKKLKSFKGAPSEIKGDLSCLNCPNIRTLEHLPKKINKLYYPESMGSINDQLEKYNINVKQMINSAKYFD